MFPREARVPWVQSRQVSKTSPCSNYLFSRPPQGRFSRLVRVLTCLLCLCRTVGYGRIPAGERQTPQEGQTGWYDGILGSMPAWSDKLAEIKERSEFDDGGESDEQWFGHVEQGTSDFADSHRHRTKTTTSSVFS